MPAMIARDRQAVKSYSRILHISHKSHKTIDTYYILCSNVSVDTTNSVSAPTVLDLPEFTPKQEAFIDAYIELRNGTKAALKAGYARAGASTEAYRLLNNAQVSAEIKRRLNSAGWTKDRVIYEVNDGYEEAKKQEDLKERREFVTLMCKLMGFLSDQTVNLNLGILGITQARLSNFIGRSLGKPSTQVITHQQVTTCVSDKQDYVKQHEGVKRDDVKQEKNSGGEAGTPPAPGQV